MAYQHLFGSSAGGASGAGYKTLASTPEFYNVMSDDELSNYNNYSFISGDEHPIKFCHYYKEYKQCFIQSAISFEYDYVGRNSSIAHTLVLTEGESNALLYDHICPFSPAMFMNTRSEDFRRPDSETLPAVDYSFLPCRDREYNTAAISKFFKSDIFAQFILAIFLAAENNYSIFVALPGSPKEISFNAIRLMNILTPAFPAEYRKKMGFMTHVTDTYAYEDISIYFVCGINLSKQFVNSAYCFDLTGDKPYVSGFEPSTVKQYYELIRTVMSNILSYNNPTLNEYFDDILPKVDPYDRFNLEKINEIYFMWKFLSGSADDDLPPEIACRIIASFYDFYDIVDNKAKFLNRINGYWEREIENCKAGGYAPSIEIFSVINKHYPSFGEDDKRQAQRIWSFVLIYTLSAGDSTIYDKIFSYEYEGSELAADIFDYIVYIYVGFLYRRDNNSRNAAVYQKIVGGYIASATAGNDTGKLFSALKHTISITDRFYEEMSLDKKSEYDLYASAFLGSFKEPVAAKINDAGMTRKFAVMQELRSSIVSTPGDLGNGVYDYFHSSCFIPGIVSGFNEVSIAKMADDRKLVTDLSHCIEDCPELNNVEIISLFQRYVDILGANRDLSMIFELNDLVNKPDQQKTLTNWVGIYNRKYPELILALFEHTTCQIASGGSIEYNIDYTGAYKTHFDILNRDCEQMMRDLNRFIGEVEAVMNRAEYKDLGLGAFKEPTLNFINSCFFDKSVDKKLVKENEARLKRYDRIRNIRLAADPKEKKHKLFGKK
ncbi:MAG: hypothetical protein IK093_15195 [Ruminiclostridium sp.]|nr:hypothetical protein [Ruminiclostridium sp.]